MSSMYHTPLGGFNLDAKLIHQANVMLAGVSAGLTGTVFGHPLDLIKVRLQARTEYKGTVDCLTKIFKDDGARGLFRGICSPLFGLTFLNAMAFAAYTQLNDVQLSLLNKQGHQNDPAFRLSYYNHLISGAGVGLICSFFSCPFEVVKIRMQLDTRSAVMTGNIASYSHKYSGSIDCFKKVLKNEGARGLYSGYLPTTVRDVAFCATYFAIYESTKRFLKSKSDGNGFSIVPIVVAGGFSGALAWACSLPFDVVKTLIQKNDQPGVRPKMDGMFAIAKKHYATVGITGFYTGLTPAIIRAFLVSSMRFLTFESVLHLLDRFWENKYKSMS